MQEIGKEAVGMLQACNRVVGQHQRLPSGHGSQRAMLDLLDLHSKVMEGGTNDNLKAAVNQLKAGFLQQLKVEHDKDLQKWEAELVKHKNCYVTRKSTFECIGIVATKVSLENAAMDKHKQCRKTETS